MNFSATLADTASSRPSAENALRQFVVDDVVAGLVTAFQSRETHDTGVCDPKNKRARNGRLHRSLIARISSLFRRVHEFPKCEFACLKASLELLDAESTGDLAAIITEPLFSAGGIIEPPPGWFAALRKACDERGMLLIYDEAHTGLGKLGKMFACEQEGVIPDIMTISKHFGGGVEIGAVVTTPEIEDKVVRTGMVIGHSHTNDPLACNAAGSLAVHVSWRSD